MIASRPWPRTLFRVGLAGAGGLLLHLALVVAQTGPRATSRVAVLLCVVAGAAGLALLGCASLGRPPRALRWAILGAYLFYSAGHAVVWMETPAPPRIDGGLYADLAGELLRRGENPYTWDYGGVAGVYRTSHARDTARLDGSIGGTFPYPALSFLLTAPLGAVGLPGSVALAVAAHALALVLLFLGARRSLQPVVLLPLVIGPDLAPITLMGLLDTIWAALLVACVAAWGRPGARAVSFGLACSVKQTPWLLAPFLLVRVWKDEGGRPAAIFAVLALAVFAAINGPFLVWGPGAWLAAMLAAARDPLVVISQGSLASLAHFGLLGLPRGYHAALALAALLALLVCYWACYSRLRDTCWVLPGPVYWLTYRPHSAYWVFWLFPALAAIAARPARALRAAPPPRWRVAGLALVAFAAIAVGGFVWAAVPPTIAVAERGPLWVSDLRVVGMSVDVTNRTARTLTPRFAIQSPHTFFNPLPWRIEDGPAALAPYATATYRLAASGDDRTFFPFERAQVVVTDAGGDYTLRGTATLPPDRSLLWPRAVTNPAFRFWNVGGRAPFGWVVEPEAAAVTPGRHDGREAVELAISPGPRGRIALTTWIIFPDRPLRFRVAMDDHARATAAVVLDDGQSRLRIELPPGTAWGEREIDFAAEYARTGRPLPTASRVVYREIEGVLRLARLTLELSGRGPARAWLGPIEVESRP